MWEMYLGILLGFAKAFIVGGLICTLAQIVINYTDLSAGKILVLFMLCGVALQGLGLYQYLVEFAGAGATVPLTGFGFSLAKGVEKAIGERGLIGALTGGLTATAGGITAAMMCALLASVFFRGKPMG